MAASKGRTCARRSHFPAELRAKNAERFVVLVAAMHQSYLREFWMQIWKFADRLLLHGLVDHCAPQFGTVARAEVADASR